MSFAWALLWIAVLVCVCPHMCPVHVFGLCRARCSSSWWLLAPTLSPRTDLPPFGTSKPCVRWGTTVLGVFVVRVLLAGLVLLKAQPMWVHVVSVLPARMVRQWASLQQRAVVLVMRDDLVQAQA